MENENIKVVKENENEINNEEAKEEVGIQFGFEKNEDNKEEQSATNAAPNQVIHNITVEVAKGGWYHDIFVAENFKITRDDGEVIDFKADTVEKGLVIPMFKPDGTPYYQLIDFETLDYIIEQFFQTRIFKDRMMIIPPLPIE